MSSIGCVIWMKILYSPPCVDDDVSSAATGLKSLARTWNKTLTFIDIWSVLLLHIRLTSAAAGQSVVMAPVCVYIEDVEQAKHVGFDRITTEIYIHQTEFHFIQQQLSLLMHVSKGELYRRCRTPAI